MPHNPAHPFDVVLTPYVTREGGNECGFWARDDLHDEVLELLLDNNNDAAVVGQLFADLGFKVAIQHWTWQEAEFNRRVFGSEPMYPDVHISTLIHGMKKSPLVPVVKGGH